MMERHLRFSHHFGELLKKYYNEKIPSKEKKISKCKKKISFFSNTISEDEIKPKKIGLINLKKFWTPNEENALKELKIFLKERVEDYSEARNFPNVIGTSKLSPYIKHGQIHVQTIMDECYKIKKRV